MGPEPITLYKMDALTTSFRDGWELTPHGRLAWLQRFLWRWLVKMRAVSVHMTDKVDIIRLPCDADTILGKIMESREGMFRAYREPREVLIGPETLAKLINAPELGAGIHLSPSTLAAPMATAAAGAKYSICLFMSCRRWKA